jgi:hypothetical protein
MLREPVARAYSHWWDRTCRGMETLPFREALDANVRDLEVEGRFVGEAGERRWRAGLSPDMRLSTVRTYLDVGHYATHLSRYLSLFPRRQLAIYWLEDLIADPATVLNAICRFLDVPAFGTLPRMHRNAALTGPAGAAWRVMFRNRLHHVVPTRMRHWIRGVLSSWGKRPSLPSTERAWLEAYYAPHNDRLHRLLGDCCS